MTSPVPSPGSSPVDGLDPTLVALARCVHETEVHVSAGGWDGPVRVFALVNTARALAADPAIATLLPAGTRVDDPHHLLAIEQEGLPEADSLESLLAQLAWPDAVDGAAVVVERLVVPPDAEADLPGDLSEDEAVARLAAHPGAEDVRLAAGVLRTGESWCAIRARGHDDDLEVAGGQDAVPGLVAALRATLS
ncbi:hypothetical protein EDD28_2127 [Salana multivorans]|uniref:Uncharacterized protein n=1 Tax=Salana multivorans TaxID=120377 RepID=A0A3N2DCZ0_9MICO|nr:PPA1309 family protein [Salana multivorans]OJX97908.1 MAG: hypothetical protein BGO96_13435 [Micrococcales bacterium 73-15]ROR97528.1 hypothetical protein EDD28_2127 [Salana multivorans]